MENEKCRVCEEYSVVELINFFDQPIVHKLETIKDADYRTYPFIVGHCLTCNFVGLTKPIDPEILYENYFTVSAWKNQPHVSRLIELITHISNAKLDQKILEIGCNDGSFLQSLKSSGFSDIQGIEPTKDSYDLAVSKDIVVEHDFFPNKNIKQDHYDLVISRHVLEHITDLKSFFLGVNLCLKDNGVLIIEIPDSENSFHKLDYALWEEHVNYFTYNTVKLLLNKNGFEVIHYEKTLFSGVAITLFAQKVDYEFDILIDKSETSLINSYKEKFPIFKKLLHEFIKDKKEISIYGCGARSCNFVNFLGLDMITSFVDDQEEKQNKFVPGCNIPIVPWSDEFNSKYFFLGVNSENEAKLIQKRNLIETNLISILPPSKNLPTFWRKLINS